MQPASKRQTKSVKWLAIVAAIFRHAGGFNRKSRQLFRDYLTVYWSGRFDREFYLRRNPDVAAAGLDPLFHYLAHGEKEGRAPSADLSARRLTAMVGGRRSRKSRLATLARSRGKLPPMAERSPRADDAWELPVVQPKPSHDIRKKLVVYTAIFDDYDGLIQPEPYVEEIDYVCFSNRRFEEAGVWQLRSLDYFNSSPRRMARYAKLHPHRYFPEYEWSLWVDGRIVPKINPLALVKPQDQGELFAFHHPQRNSPYEEGLEAIHLQLDEVGTVESQMRRYRDQNLPLDVPLHETGVLLRKHMSPSVMQQSRLWWSEIERGSVRDQLSFDYAAWRTGLRISPLAPAEFNVRNDGRFAIVRHKTHARADSEWSSAVASEPVPPILAAPLANPSVDLELVDIVVCVHNALEDVKRCLQSIDIARHATQRLIVVDDGSAAETSEWLGTHVGQQFPHDLLLRRESAGGYTIAANTGLRATSAPYVVMLNSDAIVPAGWITKLKRALRSAPEIGLAGPLSNAASFQSVPSVTSDTGHFEVNDLPSGMTVEGMDALCERIGHGLYPRVPCLNGFCLLISRSVIDRIGLFDEVNFPRGYGEENDYGFRATEAGYSSVVACDTYVFHAKSRSYTSQRRDELARAAGIALKTKWSENRVRSVSETMQLHPWLAGIRQHVAAALVDHRAR